MGQPQWSGVEIAAEGGYGDDQYSNNPEDKFPDGGGSTAFTRDRRGSPGGIKSRAGYRHGPFSIRKVCAGDRHIVIIADPDYGSMNVLLHPRYNCTGVFIAGLTAIIFCSL